MFCCIKKKSQDILFCDKCQTFFYNKKQYKLHLKTCKKIFKNGEL